jgi:hypothetical protein
MFPYNALKLWNLSKLDELYCMYPSAFDRGHRHTVGRPVCRDPGGPHVISKGMPKVFELVTCRWGVLGNDLGASNPGCDSHLQTLIPDQPRMQHLRACALQLHSKIIIKIMTM